VGEFFFFFFFFCFFFFSVDASPPPPFSPRTQLGCILECENESGWKCVLDMHFNPTVTGRGPAQRVRTSARRDRREAGRKVENVRDGGPPPHQTVLAVTAVTGARGKRRAATLRPQRAGAGPNHRPYIPHRPRRESQRKNEWRGTTPGLLILELALQHFPPDGGKKIC
jgi:hypothetical protein